MCWLVRYVAMIVALLGSVEFVCLLVYGRGDSQWLPTFVGGHLGRVDDIYAMFIMCFGQALSVPLLSGCHLSIVAPRIIDEAFCLGMLGLSASVGGRGFLGAYVTGTVHLEGSSS